MLKNRPIQELPADATACTLTDEEIYRKQCGLEGETKQQGFYPEVTMGGDDDGRGEVWRRGARRRYLRRVAGGDDCDWGESGSGSAHERSERVDDQ